MKFTIMKEKGQNSPCANSVKNYMKIKFRQNLMTLWVNGGGEGVTVQERVMFHGTDQSHFGVRKYFSSFHWVNENIDYPNN